MSGGHFEYKQHHINDVAEKLESDLVGGLVSKHLHKEPLEIQRAALREIIKGLWILQQATIYADRIDWFLSGDDGAETFLTRLKEALAEVKK